MFKDQGKVNCELGNTIGMDKRRQSPTLQESKIVFLKR